ncbi:MAG: adenylate/guanylate cyclase domain-containing protein [Oceanococcus sp.]
MFVVVGTIIVCAILSLRGSTSRLPFYLFVYGYSSWSLMVVTHAGSFDSAYIILPVFLLLMMVLVDGWRSARHLIFLWSFAAVAIVIAQHYSWMPYASGYAAPMETVRSSTGWLLLNVFFVAQVLCSVCGVMWVVTNSRDRALFELEQSRKFIRRYIPPAVADQIIAGNAAAIDAPARRRITVLFSDIVSFTDMADRLDAESLTQILNEYMAAMANIIGQHGGTLNEFSGDGLMALFGAPNEMEPKSQALNALQAAQEMQNQLPALNEHWLALGIGEPLQIRIGINTGVLSVGSFGSEGRMTYTAIGLQTNIASRIQSHCEPDGVLLSDASWHLVKDQIDCEPFGEIQCKGVHFPVKVYAPIREK